MSARSTVWRVLRRCLYCRHLAASRAWQWLFEALESVGWAWPRLGQLYVDATIRACRYDDRPPSEDADLVELVARELRDPTKEVERRGR